MKLSVSLSVEDVALLDAYAREHDLASRSAAVQYAVQLLRDADLEEQYAEAYREWTASGDAAAWEVAVGDGIGDDPESDNWAQQYQAWQDRSQPEAGDARAAG